MARAPSAALLALVAGACALPGTPRVVLPALEREGEVHVYLEPLPREAERLSFSVAGVGALGEDGVEVPLEVEVKGVSGAEPSSAVELAWGRIPPGRYKGLVVRVRDASLGSGSARSALLPGEPRRVSLQLDVAPRRAVLVRLSLNYAESLDSGSVFAPVFSGLIPPKTAAAAVGYSSSTAMASLTAFDRQSRRVTGIIPVGQSPEGVAIDARAGRAYVAISAEDAVDVVDVAAAEVRSRIRLRGGDRPRDVAVLNSGELLVLNPGSRTASFVEPQSGIEVARVPVGVEPWSLLLDRSGQRAYVFNRRSNSITVVDAAARAVVATAATEAEPLRGQLNRAGDRLFVLHAGSPYLLSLSVPQLAVQGRLLVGTGATTLKYDTRTEQLFVAWADEPRIRVYDAFALVPIDEFELPGGASRLAIDEWAGALLALLPARRSVAVVDLTSRRTLAVMEVGPEPFALEIVGDRR